MQDRYNPFEGLDERVHEDNTEQNPAIKRLVKSYNTFEYDGFLYEYELANQMEVWASGSDYILESLQALAEDYKDLDNLSEESIQEKVNKAIYANLEREKAKMDAGEENDFDKIQDAADDAKIAYRSLVLNKLVRIHDIEQDVDYEITPELIWSMQDLIAEELYARICGGRTAFSEVVDRFLDTYKEEQAESS